MTPDLPLERWADADRIFAAALDLPEAEREMYVARTSAGDAPLCAAVLALLRAEGASRDFLGDPAGFLPAGALQALGGAASDAPPMRAGQYRLIEEIGRGGWGSVYLAERDTADFRQRVALKLLRRGLDTDEVLERFRAERRILASLNHPNIARLIDGGASDDGRPFLVMELVEGRSITEHCEAEMLSVPERLQLFTDVCRAVSFAHRNLIIHRDLKPGNIHVAGDGQVKLLDFGIAKLLDEGDAGGGPRTRLDLRPMTPQYASPEQLLGEPISTASDVYQLGLLLYELLAGVPPRTAADTSRPLSVEECLTHTEPPPPSQAALLRRPAAGAAEPRPPGSARQLSRTLRGDLDTIVLKALRRDPDRRYATVAELIEDIERYTAGQPVRAQPDRWSYRARKFVGRRPGIAAAVVLLLAGTAGYVGTLRQHAAALERERNVARSEGEKAARAQAFLTDLFRSADPFLPDDRYQGSDVTVRDALALGAQRVRTELPDQPELQAALLGTISDVYTNLELYAEAQPLREEAWAIEQALWGAESLPAAASMERLASLHWHQGRLADAESLFHSYIALVQRLRGPGSADEANGLNSLGLLQSSRGEEALAITTFESAVAAYRRAGHAHTNEFAGALTNLGGAYEQAARFSDAETVLREALDVRARVFGEEHPYTAISLNPLASLYHMQGRLDEAETTFRRAADIFEGRLGGTHEYTLSALNNLANVISKRGDHAAAEHVHRLLLEKQRSKHGAATQQVAVALQNLSTMLARQRRFDEAAPLALEAHDLFLRTVGPQHPSTPLPLLTLADMLLEQQQWGRAEEAAAKALQLLQKSLPPGHFVTAVAEGRLGRAVAGQGRFREAEPLLRRSLMQLTASEAETSSYAREIQAALDRLPPP